MINPGLRHRTVLITGTDNRLGIGAAVGSLFVEMGARPFLHRYRPAGESAADGRAIAADLSNPSVVPDLFDEAERRSGPVEVLVNNAASWSADTFLPPAQRDSAVIWNCGSSRLRPSPRKASTATFWSMPAFRR